MGHGIVCSRGVENLAQVLVGCELDRLEGDGHGEGGWVGDVEGAEALGLVDFDEAIHNAGVDRSVDLHSLLDHVERIHQGITGDGGTGASGS